MDLPVKRKSTTNTLCPPKRLKIFQSRSSKLESLSQNLLNLILDFLSLIEVVSVLPTLNSFFRNLSKKSCKSRSNLEFDLNLISQKFLRRQLKIEDFSEFISSKNLEVLKLKVKKFLKSSGRNSGLDKILNVLINAESFKTLRFFKLDCKNFSVCEVEEMTGKLDNLESLVISSNLKFPDLIQFVNEKVVSKFPSFKKLELNYCSFTMTNDISEIIEHILNTSLTHFCLKFTNNFLSPVPLARLDIQNFSLISLSLPPEFVLTHESSESVCRFLMSCKTLQVLSISSTISRSLHNLVKALSNNKTLRFLKLSGFQNDRYLNYELNSVDCIEIMKAIKSSRIQNLSLSINFTTNKSFYIDMDEEKILNQKLGKFIQSFQEMVEKNKIIKKISITLHQVPFYIVKRYCKILIQLVRAGKLHFLFGYNFFDLIFGKLRVFDVKKRHVTLNSCSKEFRILAHLVKLSSTSSLNVERIVDRKVFGIDLSIRDLARRIKSENEVLVTKTRSEFVNFINVVLFGSIQNSRLALGDNREVIDDKNFYKILAYLDTSSKIYLIKKHS